MQSIPVGNDIIIVYTLETHFHSQVLDTKSYYNKHIAITEYYLFLNSAFYNYILLRIGVL